MRPQSCKAKGRRFQQKVRDDLRLIYAKHGLEDGDCESRGMGQNGEDVILSPAAKRVLNLAVECKNVETLNIVKTFVEHFEKYKNQPSLKLLVHTKNRSVPLVTLRWEDFVSLIDKGVNEQGIK